MSLTDRDVANTEMLHSALDARSNAHAVAIALSLTAFLVDELRKGNALMLRTPEGELQKLVMTELAPVTRAQAASQAETDAATQRLHRGRYGDAA